ncbi:MAG: hypothetical protein ACLQAH_07385 [Limisphaerales bacterium]
MKAWICIYAIVFAAGAVTVSAEETNTQTGSGTIAVPPSASGVSTSTAAKEVKPTAVAPAMSTNAVPAQSKTATTPRMSPGAATPMAETSGPGHKGVSTNPPPTPAEAEGVKPPEEVSSAPSNNVSAETGGTAAAPPANGPTPSPDNTGIGNKGALAIGAAILVAAGGLAAFMLRRFSIAPHGSLITSAMNVTKHEDKDEDKDVVKPEEKPEEKKVEKKFPPPMT